MNDTIKTMINQFCYSTSRLNIMTGATNMSYSNTKNEFYFRFKMCSKANCCRLKYNEGLDLYEMEFNKLWGNSFKSVKEYDGLYFDQLKAIFEDFTGLRLSL